MANGAPPANGRGAALLGMAAQQADEQRELLAHLQATLKSPARIVRDKVCIVAVGWEGEPPRDYPVILVALPNGPASATCPYCHLPLHLCRGHNVCGGTVTI